MEDKSDDYHDTGETVDIGKHGKDYEVEMAKFLLKRLMEMNFKNFKFTREKKGLGKFDDLVFVFEDDHGVHYSLVQFKHVLNEDKNITYDSLAIDSKSYFYLPKYFSHFLESSTSGDVIKDANLHSLIMCTNIQFDNNLKEINKICISNDGIFKNSGSVWKLSMSRDAKRNIFSESYISDGMRLARELCMYILLNKVIDINTLIKHEHVSLIKKYHRALSRDVVDCSKKAFKNEFLQLKMESNSPVLQFREAIVNFINSVHLKCKTLDDEQLKHDLGITARRMKNLKSNFEDYDPSNVLEFLKKLTINFKTGFGEQICSNYTSNILPSSSSINADILDTKIDLFLDKLLFAVEQKNKESLLRQEMSLDTFISYSDKMNEWYHGGSVQNDGKISRKREWISKDKLVTTAMNLEIKFQGRHLCLGQLVKDQTLLDYDTLMNAFCSRSIDIGNVIERGGEPNIYYISRLLTRRRQLQNSFLKIRNSDVVFLTVNKTLAAPKIAKYIHEEEELFALENIGHTSRFIFADPENAFGEKEFDDILKKYKAQFEWENVHWLEIANEHLLWKKTEGSLKDLQSYFLEDITENDISESTLADTQGMVIISGEPGMGKSTLLQRIAEAKLRLSTPMWIIKVMIKDILQKLDIADRFKDRKCVLDLLTELENVPEKFSKTFLEYCLMNKRAVLMFDGFDETRTNIQEENLLNLLKCLHTGYDTEQIFVTTRPHRKINLENNFGVVSFSIKEINPEQQILFLSKFWMQTTEQAWDHISQYSNMLVNNLNTSLTCHGKNFLGIPLQTYMFAIVFLEEVMKDRPVINNNVDVASLFRRFLRTKYDLYFKKFGVIFLPEDIKNLLVKLLDEIHQNFALSKGGLLSTLDIQDFINKQITLNDDRLLEIGIVYKSNETFRFIHKTFEEYLTAKRLADIALSKEKSPIINILKKLIASHDSKFLMYLFDSELTENYPLHNSVLCGLEEKVRTFDEQDVNAKDCLKRSLFYYAVQYRHFNILEILLSKKLCLDENDKFLIISTIAYLENCYTYNIKSLGVTDQIFSSLLDTSFNFSLRILDAFDMNIEMKRKNWLFVKKVLNARQVSGIFGNNVYFLENALNLKAPIDIILLLFESIRMKQDSLENYKFAYSYFMKYLFTCNEESIVRLLRRYNGAFESRAFLYIDVFVYFDLRKLVLGDSFSSLITHMEERASHFALIVKNLLENGASYLLLKKDDANEIFDEGRINLRLVKLPIIHFIEENFKNVEQYFNLTLDEFTKEENLPSSLDECHEVLQKFNFVSQLPQNTVQDFIVAIVMHILRNTDAVELLYLVHCFHQAVKRNNYKLVYETLRKAEKRSWKRALLNSTNGDFKTPEEVARRKFYLRIYIFLRRNR